MDEKITIQVFDKIPPELQKSVDALANRCFSPPNRTPEQKAESNDQFFETGDEFKFVLAIENNETIGLVIALKRNINFNGNTILLGGVGGVCVREDRRKKGIATKLMDLAMEELKKHACDVAYLCTDFKKQGTEKLYSRLGFVSLGKPHTYLGKSGKRYFDTDGMIAPINSREIFNSILKDSEPFDIGSGNW